VTASAVAALPSVYDAIGVQIGHLEAQQANITIRTLAILCRYYGISLAELVQEL